MNPRRLVLIVGFLALMYFFGDLSGLVAGVLIAAGSLVLHISRDVYWAAAVCLLALSPAALVLQGLPSGPIAGAGFGTRHLASHVLVGLALASAAWAGLNELVERGEGPKSLRPSSRRSPEAPPPSVPEGPPPNDS